MNPITPWAIALTILIGAPASALAQPAAGPAGTASVPAEKLAPMKATAPAGKPRSHHRMHAPATPAQDTGAGPDGSNLGKTTTRSMDNSNTDQGNAPH